MRADETGQAPLICAPVTNLLDVYSKFNKETIDCNKFLEFPTKPKCTGKASKMPAYYRLQTFAIESHNWQDNANDILEDNIKEHPTTTAV